MEASIKYICYTTMAIVGPLYAMFLVLAGRCEATASCPKVEVRFAVKNFAAKAQKFRTPAVDAEFVEVAFANAQIGGHLPGG